MAAPEYITLSSFQEILDGLSSEHGLDYGANIAVGLSGGPDSLALTKLLSEHAKAQKNLTVHAIIIDHGIRPESASEAKLTADTVEKWPRIVPEVISLSLGPLKSKVQETARDARYEAFKAFCDKNNIQSLFLGHHCDDLFETMLFRLAKGSGLDGLSGMSEITTWEDTKHIIRPLLQYEKIDLINTCKNYGVKWIEDFSNRNQAFSRTKYREAKKILEKDGLTSKKLYITSKRLHNARQALEELSKSALKKCIKINEKQRIVLDKEIYAGNQVEMRVRILKQCLSSASAFEKSHQKLKKIEHCARELCLEKRFRTRTLYGCKIYRDDKNNVIVIESEDI